ECDEPSHAVTEEDEGCIDVLEGRRDGVDQRGKGVDERSGHAALAPRKLQGLHFNTAPETPDPRAEHGGAAADGREGEQAQFHHTLRPTRRREGGEPFGGGRGCGHACSYWLPAG